MQQSMANTIMNIVLNHTVQHFKQKGLLGSIMGGSGQGEAQGQGLSSRNSSSLPMQSALTQLMSLGASDPSRPLVQEVKSKAGLRDDNQAKQYTQQAIGVLQENAGKDSQGFGSLIGSFLGGQGAEKEGRQHQQGKGGGLGDIVGDLLGGSK